MRLKMSLTGTKLGHFPDCSWLHQHSETILGHITQFRYLTRACISSTSLNNCQKKQEKQPALRAPFHFTAVPTPTEATLTQNHRSPDSGLFYASSQVTRLKLSTPPYPRENNKKLKTMSPLSVLGERIGVANHKGGTGQFWRGNGAILGSTWHEIE